MRKYSPAGAALIAAVAILAPATATAQHVDCRIVMRVYEDSARKGKVCRGRGGICVNHYLICDGQPYPFPEARDYGSAPGHLTTPPPRLALLNAYDGAVKAKTQIGQAVSSCESVSLFERLDRRRSLHLHESRKPEPLVGSALVTPAVP